MNGFRSPPGEVSLEPLAPEDFAAWAAHSRRGFVEQQVLAGLPREEAVAYAERSQAALLPQGPRTPGHHLWVVRAGGDAVGHLWLQVRRVAGGHEAYVYDVELEPRARGRGLGRATMLAAERAARALGATRVRLNVFSHNAPATGLYDGLGYVVLETLVGGPLGDGPAPYDAGPAGSLHRRPQVNPGHELWTACDGGTELGSVCLHLVERSGGLHADGHDVAAARPEHAAALLAACVRHARARGAVALSLAVSDPAVLEAGVRAGLVPTAELREKRLTG